MADRRAPLKAEPGATSTLRANVSQREGATLGPATKKAGFQRETRRTRQKRMVAREARQPQHAECRYPPAMELSDEFYGQVVDGSADPPELRLRIGLVKRRIRRSLGEAAPEKVIALRATSTLEPSHQLELLPLFLDDEDQEVRSYALNLAIAAKADGTRLLREAIRSSRPDIVLPALDLLTRGVDKASTTRIAALLTSGQPTIRAAAVRFLGHAAGASFRPRLTRMLADPDSRVAHAAELAMARLEGSLARRPSQDWWTADPLPLEEPDDQTVPPPELEAVELLAPDAPPAALQSISALADLEAEEPHAPPAPHLPAVVTSAAPHELTWELDQPSPLPTDLPVEATATGRLLSRVSASEREGLLRRLRTSGEDRIVVDALTRSRDPLDRAAAAVAVQGLAMKARVANILRLLRDDDPRVRAASATALAELVGISALPQLARVLLDEDLQARHAAALALATAARRLDERRIAEHALAEVEATRDPENRALIAEARAILQR